ncbi:MAG TPA: hypothetical protein VNI52_07070 [Sphingobacteriaceae bacterium]|nr:hypothetical protein [Sphingobacteriaceae bacterium]
MKKNLFACIVLLLAFTACNKIPLTEEVQNDQLSTKNAANVSAVYAPGLDDTYQILLNTTGYNPRFTTINEPWRQTDPNYQLGLVDSKANMIRYPGGTFANFWNYNQDKMFRKMSTNDPDGWVDLAKVENQPTHDAINADNLKLNSVSDLKYAAKGGTSGQSVNVVFHMNMVSPGYDYYKTIHPTWTAPNPGTSNLNDTWYKMLNDRYARFKGMLLRAKTGTDPITVQFIELGNEYYFDHAYCVEAFPTGGAHGKAANYIANKLKNDTDLNLSSTVRIAGTASCVPGGAAGTRKGEWNNSLKSTLDKNIVDYVTMHEYQAFVQPTTYNETNFQTKLVDWIASVNSDFVESGADANFISPSIGTPWRIWYTETNANWDGASEGAGPVEQRTWGQSMVEAYSALHLYDRGNATMYLQFQFNNQVRANSDIVGGLRLYNRALALIPFMKATQGAVSGARVSFAGTGLPTLPGSAKGVVAGYYFTTLGGAKKCCFINLSATSKQLNLGANIFTTGSSTVKVEAYNNTSIGSEATPAFTSTSYTKTNVTLKPYSVSYIYQ